MGAYLRTVLLGLLTIASFGCANLSPAPTPVPACTFTSSTEFAYVLNDGDNTVSMYTVDSCTGDLAALAPSAIATGANAFGSEEMVVDSSRRFAYVANLGSNASDEATISMYTINSRTGDLTPTTPATVPTGFYPQGIAIDPSGKFVYTANSDDNTVSMFTVNSGTGVLTPTTPPTVATGWSPLSVTVDPTGRFAYAANQDDGTISMFTINSSTGVLTPTSPATVPAGGSPFGVTVDPSGKFAYVPNAYDPNNFVSQYTINSITGVLTPTTPSVVAAGNSPASVAVDPSGKFAYVVNRQDNTVSMYTVDPNSGNLRPNGIIATGIQPFRAAVDPAGKFLYVGNQNGGTISIYRISSAGTLSPASTAATGSDPVSLAITKAIQ